MPPKARRTHSNASAAPPSLVALKSQGRLKKASESDQRKSESKTKSKSKIELAILGDRDPPRDDDEDDDDIAGSSKWDSESLVACFLLLTVLTVIKKRKESSAKALMDEYDEQLDQVVAWMGDGLGSIEQGIDANVSTHKRRVDELQDEISTALKKIRAGQDAYQTKVVNQFEQIEANSARLTRLRRAQEKEMDEIRK
ncbi:hypothetical protein HDU93_007104 [Gonapodya sp. JEL0774]|nr:hypothetical protein HDU93_007104 [Gonapodya sp. JEL0774]